MAAPQLDVQETPVNRLSRYNRMQQLVQQFWTRWSQEYLLQLQKRHKWTSEFDTDLKIGSLVLLIDDHTPPLKWPLARVIDLHSGNDKKVRVISVKVANGSVFKRSLKKIWVLPLEKDNFPDLDSSRSNHADTSVSNE